MSTVQVDTINESTTDSGVTVDGVLIKDGQVDGVDVSTLSVDTNGLVLLQTGTASNSSELLFDDFVDLSTYASYFISVSRIKSQNDNVELRFAFRQGGSSGSDLTGTYAQGGVYYYGDTTTSGNIFGNSSNTDYHVYDNSNGSGSAEAMVGEGYLYPATGSTSDNVTIFTHTGVKQMYNDEMRFMQRTTFKEDVTAVTGIRFYYQTGNIVSGTIRIYGVKS